MRGKRRPIEFTQTAGGCFACTSHVANFKKNGRTMPSLWRNRHTMRMQEYLYSELFGPIPEGCAVFLTCGDNSCINPAHYKVAPEENRRG